jgi:hypothetical protein
LGEYFIELSLPLSPRGNNSFIPASFADQAPVIAVIAFGFYLAIWLVIGVATFRTVPKEAESLQRDIIRAKSDLKKHGIRL